MPHSHTFTFPLPNGLHARPASYLQAVAGRFAAAIALVNKRSGTKADAKSILSLIATDIRHGDACELQIAGDDAEAALGALTAFIRDVLPGVDQAPPADLAGHTERPLPRSLVAAGLDRPLRGTPVSPGIGIGTIVVMNAWALPPEAMRRPPRAVDEERAVLASARQVVTAALSSKLAAAKGQAESDILSAHLAIAGDLALIDRAEAGIAAGQSAVQAVAAAAEYFAATLAASTSQYLRERALDVRDVTGQLLRVLCGQTPKDAKAVVLDQPSIVVAGSLTPGQLLGLDRRHLHGLVLAHAGMTSHTVILARSMGLPTIVGVAAGLTGGLAVVDANLGIVVAAPAAGVLRYYQMELTKQKRQRDSLGANRDRPGATADGRSIDVAANVASAEEVGPAMENGAHGVGLFRTEMIFMDRSAAPTEDEQVDIYSRAAAMAAGKPLIVRLLDAGGDKPIPYLNLPTEANPFLGYRAVRFYQAYKPLILSQLRAVLRAADHGDVRVMIPMVCCVEEVREVRAMLAEAAEGLPAAKLPPLGIMVEVPSVALIIDRLCDEVDFFSIGSNDLTQYFLAADRDNARVTGLCGWSHPALLRLLKTIVDAAHAGNKWVGLCGEMGDAPAALPAIVGLGLDEVSVSGPRVPAVKQAVAKLRYDRCRTALESACECATRAEVEAIIAAVINADANLPLLSRDLIDLRCKATTKHEVIKLMTDALLLSGRTPDERAVEEAIWQREETYSTGFGYGLAMPHCKTEAVSASSVVVARLDNPIDWGSLDGTPVDMVILLAIRSAGTETANEHLRVFARLSRLVMQDEFRDRLKSERDADRLLEFLQDSLELPPAISPPKT